MLLNPPALAPIGRPDPNISLLQNFSMLYKLLVFVKRITPTFSLCTLIVALMVVPGKGICQQITGVVKDNNGKPLSGVYVKVNGSTANSITNTEGRFTTNGSSGSTLSFSHPDFYGYQARFKNEKNFAVQLSNRYLMNYAGNLSSGDSVVSAQNRKYIEILHGQQPAENVIQSIATVHTNQLTTTPSPQFLQALPGRLPGLNVGLTGGAPSIDGVGLGYNLRGRPLTILIDGVQRSYTSIDPEQIESVSVLRDALSTVMFGQRSSNGIMLVTTKKGDRGSPRISFTAQTAIVQPLKLPQTLDAGQYAQLFNEAQKNEWDPSSTQPAPQKYTQADIDAYNNGTDPYGHPNVDWYNTVLNKTSKLQRYNFNLQGSGSAVRYFVDLDYMQDDGLFKTSDANKYNTNAQVQRYIARSNVGVNITKTTFMQLNMFGRIQQSTQPGQSSGTANNGTQDIFNNLLSTPRNAYPIFNANGSLGGNDNFQTSNLWGKTVNSGYHLTNVRDLAVDIQLTQRLDALTKGLWIKAQGSYNNTSNYFTDRGKAFATYAPQPNGSFKQFGTITDQKNGGSAQDRIRVTYLEAALGYDKSAGKHNINTTLLANQQSAVVNGNLPEQYTDYAGRISYNFQEKYFAEYAASYAGYNRFSPGNRFGFFQAGGIGWNIHKENFIKNSIPAISNLKLRATYGKTGQANTGYFQYIQQYRVPDNSQDNAAAYWWGPSASLERGAYQSDLANPNLTFEKAKKLNAGIDIGLWNNKLSFSGEYYYNKMEDLIAVRGRNSVILGTSFPTENIQKFDYWGTDWSLTYQDNVKNFHYFITTNLSLVQSKVVYNDEVQKDFEYQKSTGQQVGLRFGYVATGLFQNYQEINDPKVAVFGPRSSLRPGDIRYQDRNNDGVIDDKDNGVIGSGKPTVFYGATFGFNYKGLDVSFLVQGTRNRQTYLSGDLTWPFGNNGNGNAFAANLNRWTPATAATATLPRVWIGANQNNQLSSTYWLKDADFIRLKNAEIGYTLPPTLTHRIGIPSIRAFINGLNLLTSSDIYDVRDDIDPEAFGSAYPIPRVINFGINVKL